MAVIIKKHWLLIIVLAALILRLAGLRQGYWYNQDTARDILVARGAITLGQIPWVGSFSSVGPFVFGPQWYWFLVLINFVFLKTEIAVPLAMIAVSLGTLTVSVLTAQKIAGRTFAVVTGIFLAISPYVISSSWTVSQHGMTIFFSALTIYAAVSLSKRGPLWHGVALGFAVGLAASLHTQALTLMIFFLPPIIFLRKDSKKLVKLTAYILVGLIIGLGPYLYWDSLNQFKNTKAILDYLLVGQYRFYVANRWLTYIFEFWSQIFGDFIGINGLGGIIVMLATFAAFFWGLVRKSLPKEILVIFLFFVFEFVLFRYYRGPRFRGYFLFLDPIIGLLISWTIYKLFEFRKLLAIIIFVIMGISTLTSAAKVLAIDNAARGLFFMRDSVVKRYPGEKFTLYTNHPYAGACSFNFSLILDSSGLASPNGHPLGMCLDDPLACSPEPMVIGKNYLRQERCILLDLKNDEKFASRSGWWHNFDKRALFEEIENWWRK